MSDIRSSAECGSFGDLVQNVNEYYREESDGRLPYVAGPHLVDDCLSVSRFGQTTDDDFPPTFKRLFHPGDVLLHSRNIRKIAAVNVRGVTGEKLFVLRTRDPARLDQGFLAWLLLTPQIQRVLEANFTGSVNRFVNWTPLSRAVIELPCIEEQRRIAGLLWACERCRVAAAERVVTAEELVVVAADECLQSMRQVSIADIANVATGRSFSSTAYSSETSHPRLLRGINIGPGFTRWDAADTVYWPDSEGVDPKYRLRKGDLVVAMDRVLTARGRLRSAVVESNEEGAVLNQRVARVRLAQDENPLLLQCLIWSRVFACALGGSQTGGFAPHLRLKDISDFRLGSSVGQGAGEFEVFSKAADVLEHCRHIASSTEGLLEDLRAELLGGRP